MIAVMDRVGEVIRKKYLLVPLTQKYYLVMKNTSGHSSNEAIASYTKMVEDK